MIKVSFILNNKEVYCNEGDILLEVVRNVDIFIDVFCNGNVFCGKCKVKLLNGKVDIEKIRYIIDDEWE